MKLFTPLKAYIDALTLGDISEGRKKVLQPLVAYLQQQQASDQPSLLTFICTHNARRSHLAQIWAQCMALYFNKVSISCYSGGTEATKMHPQVAETLQSVGFQLKKLSHDENPIYSVKCAPNSSPIIAFSKKYHDDFNPDQAYVAVMVCSEAAEACPYAAEADSVLSITYDDPKKYDGTEEQAMRYAERSHQIATEMKWVFSQI